MNERVEPGSRGDNVRVTGATRQQVAALCFRGKGKDREVLLITSRDTGRWVLPKGWPIDGLDDAQSALQEAWEEAGVRKARVDQTPLGHYHYDKRLSGGTGLPVKVDVYAARVEKLKDDFPEMRERKRKWISAAKAAKMVDEPELRAMLSAF